MEGYEVIRVKVQHSEQITPYEIVRIKQQPEHNQVVIIGVNDEDQLQLHLAEAFELLKLLIRAFINQGTLSHATMDSIFEEQWEQREQ